MKIVFNASNLVVGGGLSVGLGVIGSLYNLTIDDEIHVFLPRKKAYKFVSNERIKIHYLPSFFSEYLIGRFFINWYLSYRVKEIKPEAIFSMGNYAIPAAQKQLLLLQWPYAVYPESIIWKKMNTIDFLKRKTRFFLFKRNLKYANSMTVQTNIMKDRVRKHIDYLGDIHVIESSGNLLKDQGSEDISEIARLKDSKLLVCMSEYYSHKNLEVLVPVAELIRKQKLPYKILLTIKATKDAAPLLETIDKKSLNGIIINLGRIEKDKIFSIYRNCDALILPTLLESFGIPYVEAAYAKLPIITSDLDFAHEINGNTAWYFDPTSAESILSTIEKAFAEPQLMKEKVEVAFQKASKTRTWEEITKQYLNIIKNLAP